MAILVRYGELALKGLNRHLFEKKLAYNIKQCLKKNKIEYAEVRRVRGRIIISTADGCRCLANVFGVTSFSPALESENDIISIKNSIMPLIKKFSSKTTFRVTARRLDKQGLKAMELNSVLGAFIVEKTGAKVSLEDFDAEVGVEIICGKAYVFSETIKGFGGLPLGSAGNAMLLVEDEKSILAGWLMMKRGTGLMPLALNKKDISLLERYSYGINLELRIIRGIKECDRIAEETSSPALIIGRNLNNPLPDVKIPVLNPVAVMDEEEVRGRMDEIR